MPRRSNSRVPASNSAALMEISKAIRSESEYLSAIKKINANAMILAESLSTSGQIEQALLDASTTTTTTTPVNNGSSSQGRVNRRESSEEEEKRQNEMFLVEQRARLKALVARNITSERNVGAFVTAMNTVKGEVETRQKRRRTNDDVGDSEDEGDEESPNYEDMIQTKIDEVKKYQDQNNIDIKDEVLMRRCCEKLGEKDDLANDDEDLEVMNQPGGAESENAMLKCKMTLVRFVKPYRNKLCNHVYEYDAIMQYLKTKKACPIPGCNNQNMTKEQFEEDEEMRMKVRRQYRREEEEKQARDRDRDDDESNDEGEDIGVTMID